MITNILLFRLVVNQNTKYATMTEFDEKLRLELIKYKANTKTPLFKIADECEIARNSLYQFSAGNSALNGKNTHSLMTYLGLSVRLEARNDR